MNVCANLNLLINYVRIDYRNNNEAANIEFEKKLKSISLCVSQEVQRFQVMDTFQKKVAGPEQGSMTPKATSRPSTF